MKLAIYLGIDKIRLIKRGFSLYNISLLFGYIRLEVKDAAYTEPTLTAISIPLRHFLHFS
jgi:hypothetical protein